MATLLSTAQVNPNDGRRWNQGYNARARECHVDVSFDEACADTWIQLVGTEASVGPGTYKVVPFPIQGFLRESVECYQDGDVAWFAEAYKGLTEYAISRALVTQVVAGNESWIGDTAAQSVALVVTPTDVQVAAAVSAARALWFSTVVDPRGAPIMHVPPSLAPTLVRAGILGYFPSKSNNELSIWGDDVVIAPGYETTTPYIFFTGSMIVRYTSPNISDGAIHSARINNVTIPVDQLGMVDVAPCSIVRVGV
jgi:hypothetical protein